MNDKKDTLRKPTERKSIVKLLNIYKNRAVDEFVDNIGKDYIDSRDGVFSIKADSRKNGNFPNIKGENQN